MLTASSTIIALPLGPLEFLFSVVSKMPRLAELEGMARSWKIKAVCDRRGVTREQLDLL